MSEQTPGADPFVPPKAPPPLATSTQATRGFHFRALASSTWTLAITGLLAALALIVGGGQGGPAVGAAAAGAVALVALLVVWLMAGGRARDDFYTAYAEGRGLARSNGRTSVPPVTSLLRRGDKRYAEEAFSGGLPGGLEGQLALYTYEDESHDSDGNSQTTYYHFTVAVANLPETAPFLEQMAMQRRSGFRFLDGAEDIFRRRQRVELESVDADKRYEIFIGANDSMNRARQLFTPSFVVWMAENAPEGIACELQAGGLCVNVKGHRKSAGELDEFCLAASAIATRLSDEARE